MTTYTYALSDTVTYNSTYCNIIRLRVVSNGPAYVLREIDSGIVHDNILEENLTLMTNNDTVNHFWSSFTYTGDNQAASAFIYNILKCLKSSSNVQFGPNSDNTVYTLSISGQTWTKNRS